VHIRPRGFLGTWVKCNQNYFYLYLFWQLTYMSDPSTDFHAWWLKRRILAQGCAFLGICSHCSPDNCYIGYSLLQHCRSSRFLGEEVGTHNSTPPWTTVVKRSGDNSVPGMCFRMAPSYLAETLHLSTSLGSRRTSVYSECLTSTLDIPSTRLITLGDRAFPVAAARAWDAPRHLFVLRHRCCSFAGFTVCITG